MFYCLLLWFVIAGFVCGFQVGIICAMSLLKVASSKLISLLAYAL
jgi:hypothetical protein